MRTEEKAEVEDIEIEIIENNNVCLKCECGFPKMVSVDSWLFCQKCYDEEFGHYKGQMTNDIPEWDHWAQAYINKFKK